MYLFHVIPKLSAAIIHVFNVI